jgi:sulfate adenylyltransferase subunit 1 (EFTu-like GTPase family)
MVIRPNQDFRGYAGQIVSGTVGVGDTVAIFPNGRTSRVTRIATWDGDLPKAFAPMSVTLALEDELDVSRGDLIAVGEPEVTPRFEAEMVWMDERPLDPSRVYRLKHTSRWVNAEVDHGLVMNQIRTVTVTAAKPLIFDRYANNRSTGSFILVDPATNFTAGAGMIVNPVITRDQLVGRPTAAEQLARIARAAKTESEAIEAVRRALEEILE